ncbi:alpha/beta fold hydrolase [Flavobacterium alkalisoli]|uniref:Alpha/beta fold hydrolase n=1 Tax=Flavobacterium alkalisoli TaxID=2602769 RepID=A0A5B9FXJ6_9FLAO|nr:alpha/beta fold hydrolase [Flavobacterium alkalisoli]QEE49492.1 alpha/beta fold hydrolase [Flavobacterium alkalisoli]
MKKLITLITLCISSVLFAQDITGTWNGLLKVPGTTVRLVINITKTETGYSATMDSPDQGAKGIPVTTISFENNTLAFAIPAGKLEYKGTWENNIIKGTYKQNGYEIPLDLGRDEIKIEKPKRPQEPQPPYGYYTEDVTFKNENAGITLAGTLTLPKKEGNYPAVVLISGSGPQDRNSELLDHKPFLVLADYLTKNGIAVLRFDDRGVGESQGVFATSTSADFSTDAEAAFNYLKSRPEINKNKIGLIGHSEGGMIAPMVAARNNSVAFLVLMAGPGISGDEILMKQNYLINKAGGMPEEELQKLGSVNRKLYDVILKESDMDAIKSGLSQIYNTEMKPLFLEKGIPQEQIDQYSQMQIAELTSPWFLYFIRYNPASNLEKVQCPVLAINGSKDLQVPPQEDLAGIKNATTKGGNKKVTTKELPNLNHLFQECTTGEVSEYETIEQTIAPVALNEISTWIKQQVK